MTLKQLSLLNYRNYKYQDISFCDNLNILIGDNAQGKTNILEAIFVLAFTKKLYGNHDRAFIKYDEEFCRIKGLLKFADGVDKFECALSKQTKKLKINGNEVIKVANYVSLINVIMFSPMDMNLIKNGPSFRRKFLNMEISQLDNKYVNLVNNFNVILKIRNELLRNYSISFDKSYFEVITDKFISLSNDIYKYRSNFINNINSYISSIFSSIVGTGDLSLEYLSSVIIGDNYSDNLREKLIANFDKELLYKSSLYGPHRDDFSFLLNKRNLANYGSQGQQKSAILSLKLAEIELFSQMKKERPIVLLDDIFSELDDKRNNSLINYLQSDMQIIMTTTSINSIKKELLKNAKVFEVENGNVKEMI
ncbi:MAG: DNA replication/repair protein RecF [bacterium]|nr:DNA replication/repair protein RecF [bacterium]